MTAKNQKKLKRMRRKARKHQTHSTYELLRRRVEKNYGKGVVLGPPPAEKMSEVILDFAEPVLADFLGDEEYKTALSAAITAWNLALLPEDSYKQMYQETISTLQPEIPPKVRGNFQDIIESLVRRKKRHFSQYRRFIADFHLVDSGPNRHLTVASVSMKDQ